MTVWKFSGIEVYVLAASILNGFLITVFLSRQFQWPIVSSGIVGALSPILTVLVLLKLVVAKPRSYIADWVEFQFIKLTKSSLVQKKYTEVRD